MLSFEVFLVNYYIYCFQLTQLSHVCRVMYWNAEIFVSFGCGELVIIPEALHCQVVICIIAFKAVWFGEAKNAQQVTKKHLVLVSSAYKFLNK